VSLIIVPASPVSPVSVLQPPPPLSLSIVKLSVESETIVEYYRLTEWTVIFCTFSEVDASESEFDDRFLFPFREVLTGWNDETPNNNNSEHGTKHEVPPEIQVSFIFQSAEQCLPFK